MKYLSPETLAKYHDYKNRIIGNQTILADDGTLYSPEQKELATEEIAAFTMLLNSIIRRGAAEIGLEANDMTDEIWNAGGVE